MNTTKSHGLLSYFLPIIWVLLMVIAWALFGIFQEPKEPDMIRVSVIVEDSNNPKWNAFNLGLETAAKDMKVDLSIVPTSSFEDVKDQWNLVNQRVQDGAEGIIIAPFSEEGMDEYYEAVSREVSLCLVNSGVDKSETYKNVIMAVPDYEQISEYILNQIKADYGSDLRGRSIYILAKHAHEKGICQTLEQVEMNLRKNGCNILGAAITGTEMKEFFDSDLEPHIIIALDDDSLQTIAKTKASKKNSSCGIYGIGRSESCIFYLEKGIINGMVVKDDFNMGYESLVAVAGRIRNKYITTDEIAIDSISVRPGDIHNSEMEAFLFPEIQY